MQIQHGSKVSGRLPRFICALVMSGALLNCIGAELADARLLEGAWIPVRAELGGQSMPDTVLKTISMKLHDGKYDVLVAGKPDRGTYSLEPSSHPKRMTIVGTEGPNQGRRFLAIYEISGETLRMCYDLSGKEHPAEFKSLPGTQLYLVTYSRKKRSSHSSTAERQPFRPRNLLKRPSFFSFVKSIRHLTRSWGSLKVAAVLMG